jgi:hypothetical protein
VDAVGRRCIVRTAPGRGVSDWLAALGAQDPRHRHAYGAVCHSECRARLCSAGGGEGGLASPDGESGDPGAMRFAEQAGGEVHVAAVAADGAVADLQRP